MINSPHCDLQPRASVLAEIYNLAHWTDGRIETAGASVIDLKDLQASFTVFRTYA
jgi:hypothetical protein